MASHPTVKSLQKQVSQLENQIREIQWNSTGKEEKDCEKLKQIVYVQKERQIKKFSGQNDSVSIEDWIEEISNYIYSKYLDRQERADYIYSHLEGSAREEIKYRSHHVRQSPEQILHILQDMFGDRNNITILQRNFFERKQMETESLREFSYALLKLLNKVTNRDEALIPNRNRTLCDQFAQHVADPILRKELKRVIRINPDIDFLDLRQEAILWSEEEECDRPCKRKDNVVPESTSVPTKASSDQNETKKSGDKEEILNELLNIVKKQGEQIDSLTKIVSERSTTTNSDRNYGERRSIVCYMCNKPGHIARKCPNNTHNDNKQGN